MKLLDLPSEVLSYLFEWTPHFLQPGDMFVLPIHCETGGRIWPAGNFVWFQFQIDYKIPAGSCGRWTTIGIPTSLCPYDRFFYIATAAKNKRLFDAEVHLGDNQSIRFRGVVKHGWRCTPTDTSSGPGYSSAPWCGPLLFCSLLPPMARCSLCNWRVMECVFWNMLWLWSLVVLKYCESIFQRVFRWFLR